MNKNIGYWFGVSLALLGIFLVVCIFSFFVFTVLVPLTVLYTGSSSPQAIVFQPTIQPSTDFDCLDGNCVNACFSKLTPFLQSSSLPLSIPRYTFQHLQEKNMVSLVTYHIQGDMLNPPQFSPYTPSYLLQVQKDIDPQEMIWNYFAAMIPADRRQELSDYVISTDGIGNLAASIGRYTYPYRDWTLKIDIVDAGQPRVLNFTLIHEFGHLLTLNKTQIDQREEAKCSHYFTSGGCSQPNSYLNKFFNGFWRKIYDEWKKIDATKDQDSYSGSLANFYANYSSQFNSPYSATSPEEDIAESWAYFVLGPKPADDSIAHQKVLFFYNFHELVDLRNQIIYRVCKYTSNPTPPIK